MMLSGRLCCRSEDVTKCGSALEQRFTSRVARQGFTCVHVTTNISIMPLGR